jgi:hypothetical protein
MVTHADTIYNDVGATSCYSDLILADGSGNTVTMVYTSTGGTYNYDKVSSFSGTWNVLTLSLTNAKIYLDAGYTAWSVDFTHELIQTASPFTVYTGVNFNFSLTKGGTFDCTLLQVVVNAVPTTLADSGANCVAAVAAPAVGSYQYRVRYKFSLYEYDLELASVVTQLSVIALPTITSMTPAIAPTVATTYTFLFTSTFISDIFQIVFTPVTVGYSSSTVTVGITNNQGALTCVVSNVTLPTGGNWTAVLTDTNNQTFTYSTANTYWTISSYTPTTVDGTSQSTFNIAITFDQNVVAAQVASVKLHHTDGVTIVTSTAEAYAATVLTATFNTGIKPGLYNLKVTDIANNSYTIATQLYYDWVISNYTPKYWARTTQINLSIAFTHSLTVGTIASCSLMNGAITVDTLTVGAITGSSIAVSSPVAGDASGSYDVACTDNTGVTTKHPTKIVIVNVDAVTFAGTALTTTAIVSNYSFVVPFTPSITTGTITKATFTHATTAATVSTTNLTVASPNLTVTFSTVFPGGLYNLSFTDLNGSTITSTNQLKVQQIVTSVTQIEYPANVNISLDISYANSVTATDITDVTLYDATSTPFQLPPLTYTFSGNKLTAILTGGVAAGTYTLKSTDSNTTVYTYGTSIIVYNVTTVTPASLAANTAITGTMLTVTLSSAALTTPFTFKLVSVGTGAKTTMGYTQAGANYYLTHATGFATDYYTVELTNQWGGVFTTTQQVYFGFSLTSVTSTPTQVNSALAFTLTFSGTLSTNPSTTISKVTITNPAGTVILTTLDVPGTTTLVCRHAGLTVAGYHTITAYDSNGTPNTFTIATQLSIYMKINSTSTTQITANTAIAFNIVFDQALNTGDNHTVVSTINLKDTINNVTYPLTLGVAAGATMPVTRGAINIPSSYQLIATDAVGNIIYFSTINIVMAFNSFTPSNFEQAKSITFTITMSHTINATTYQTVSKVSLYDVNVPATPISTTIQSNNLSTCIITIPAGLTTLSSYVVAVFDGANNRINSPSNLQITMSMVQTVNDKFIVGDYWTSILTFSSALNAANPFLNIVSMTLFSTTYGSLALNILGVTGSTITYERAGGVPNADLYYIRAVDGNGHTIQSSFTIQIKIYVISFTPHLFVANSMLYMDVVFSENLGARSIVTINKVNLVGSTNTYQVQYNKMTNASTMNLNNIVPNYGDYGVEAYDGYNNKILEKAPTQIRITIGLISFSQEVNDQFNPFYQTITFTHDIGTGNNFQRIQFVKLRNTSNNADTNMQIVSFDKNQMKIQYMEGILTIGSYLIVAIDGFSNEIVMPNKVYVIPKGNCLQDDKTVTYVSPKPSGVYMYNGRCAKTCPASYLPDKNNLCTNTGGDSTKIVDDTVVTSCPSGSVLENKICVTCFSKGIYFFNNQCTVQCPSEFGYISSGECIDCAGLNLVLNTNGKCTAACPTLTVINNNKCVKCPAIQAWYKAECVDYCPSGTYRTDRGSCDPQDQSIPLVYKERCLATTCLHGTCNEHIQSVDCNCPTSYYGQYCTHGPNNIIATMKYYETIMQDMLTHTRNSTYVDVQAHVQLLDMQRLFEQIPGLFESYPSIIENVQELATSQLNLMNQDRIVVDPNVFLLADLAINLNVYRYKALTDANDEIVKKIQKDISDLKDRIELITDVITVRSDKYISTTQPTLSLGGKRVQIQIGYNSADFHWVSQSYKLSIMTNIDDLERSIANQVKIKKIDFRPETLVRSIQRSTTRLLQEVVASNNQTTQPTADTGNSTTPQLNATEVESMALYNATSITDPTQITVNGITSHDVKYQIYLLNETNPLNMNNLLGSGQFHMNITLPVYGLSVEAMSKYQTYYNSGIEIYDPTSNAFVDRCFSFIDPITGYDTTLNFRIQNYFNGLAASCGGRCKYAYISTDYRMLCSCLPVASEASGTFDSYSLAPISDVNFELVKCASSTLNNIGANYALYIICAIIGLAVLLTLILFLYDKNILARHLNEVIRSDGHFYHRSMGAASYFRILQDDEKPKTSRPLTENENAPAGVTNLDNLNFHRPSDDNNDNGSIGGEQDNMNGSNPDIPPVVGAPRKDSDKEGDNLVLRENNLVSNGNVVDGQFIRPEAREQMMNQINNNLFMLISKLGEKDINFKRKKPLTERKKDVHPYDNENITIIDDAAKDQEANKTINNEVRFNPYISNKSFEPDEESDSRSSNSRYNNYVTSPHKTKVVDNVLHFDEMDIKPNKNLFLNDKDRVIPVTDYEFLTTEESVKYDKRGFFRYIFDFLTTYHILFSLFKRSVLYPFHIRSMLLVFSISTEFALNAFLYSDDYIFFKANQSPEVRVSNTFNLRICSSMFSSTRSVNSSLAI